MIKKFALSNKYIGQCNQSINEGLSNNSNPFSIAMKFHVSKHYYKLESPLSGQLIEICRQIYYKLNALHIYF